MKMLSIRSASFVPFYIAQHTRFYSDEKAPIGIGPKRHPIEIHSPTQ